MRPNPTANPAGIAAYRSAAETAMRPERMLALAFAGLGEYVQRAETGFESGDRQMRAAALDAGFRVVEHLLAALDTDSEAEAVPNLADLYWFLMDRLSRANIFDDPGLLAECRPVVDNLRQAWAQVADGADGTHGTED